MEIRAESTPNPNAIKFTSVNALFENRISAKKGEDIDHPLASKIIKLEGVDNVFGFGDFLTVNKVSDVSWEDLLPKVEAIFKNYQG
ncbi:scaffolding protein [Terrilactibacillus sp. BCM23-1]|uniref:Scaffolding protein n=1 Tax=Terrilactibacillus tamarindi TaxID=2599694 RepID=A0A6N8CN85_9BACI|nr:NifU N-terminal domain-containing protein [Terrilactibacillus tamarindi]MTT30553.1 scaffolding protein [Terrilactibacillus tamarindi]